MTRETVRVEAFSDGVFAIAITLLILEIRVPHLPTEAGNAELGAALRTLWPSFLAFAGTFGSILTMWINHHGFFDLLERVDRRFLFANGFLLLLITFVPFPTALLAAYLDRPGANAASAFYCATYVGINVAYNLLWLTAARDHRLIRPGVSDKVLERIRRAYLLGFPIYVLAVVAAFWNAMLGFGICSALWIFWAGLDYRDRHAETAAA